MQATRQRAQGPPSLSGAVAQDGFCIALGERDGESLRHGTGADGRLWLVAAPAQEVGGRSSGRARYRPATLAGGACARVARLAHGQRTGSRISELDRRSVWRAGTRLGKSLGSSQVGCLGLSPIGIGRSKPSTPIKVSAQSRPTFGRRVLLLFGSVMRGLDRHFALFFLFRHDFVEVAFLGDCGFVGFW